MFIVYLLRTSFSSWRRRGLRGAAMEVDGGKGAEQGPAGKVDSPELDSDDDEVDYSIKPEFYDPDLDVRDELWVQKKIRGHRSDAILSCPACFGTLCLDCQQHEKYVNQYRAMFVMNCTIRNDQILREKARRPKRGRASKEGISSEDPKTEAVFKPVCCSTCMTEVGVFDQEEVYHFFNVLPSEP